MKFFIPVELNNEENYIKEILTRYGILDLNTNKVFQSCYLINNKSKYYLIHFKEYFSYFSFKTEEKIEKFKIHTSKEDIDRRNNLIKYLYNKRYINLNRNILNYLKEYDGNINIIQKHDKKKYKLISKFNII
jgi:hypothetical protein